MFSVSRPRTGSRLLAKYGMRYYEIIYTVLEEAEAVAPKKLLRPVQMDMDKRNERAHRTQQRIADERARSAIELRSVG